MYFYYRKISKFEKREYKYFIGRFWDSFVFLLYENFKFWKRGYKYFIRWFWDSFVFLLYENFKIWKKGVKICYKGILRFLCIFTIKNFKIRKRGFFKVFYESRFFYASDIDGVVQTVQSGFSKKHHKYGCRGYPHLGGWSWKVKKWTFQEHRFSKNQKLLKSVS